MCIRLHTLHRCISQDTTLSALHSERLTKIIVNCCRIMRNKIHDLCIVSALTGRALRAWESPPVGSSSSLLSIIRLLLQIEIAAVPVQKHSTEIQLLLPSALNEETNKRSLIIIVKGNHEHEDLETSNGLAFVSYFRAGGPY